jgi:geranylgeranylglycerol-phosphate geranylgeranyltransferase
LKRKRICSIKKARAIVQVFRPELPFAAGVCVILGEIIALGHFPSWQSLTLGFLCGFFISGSAIVFNDYFDLEVDKINTPSRPLPSGTISPSEAVLLAIIAALIGLATSFAISLPAFLLCVVFWVIGFLYNWKFKESGLAGNLMVSSSVAITFILGGMAVGEPWNKIVWCFALIGFFIDLGEEIAGDAMDIEGDKKQDIQGRRQGHAGNLPGRAGGNAGFHRWSIFPLGRAAAVYLAVSATTGKGFRLRRKI